MRPLKSFCYLIKLVKKDIIHQINCNIFLNVVFLPLISIYYFYINYTNWCLIFFEYILNTKLYFFCKFNIQCCMYL